MEGDLERLLASDLPDAFVIFEAKGSGKFVQFAGSQREGLLFDLPKVALTAKELERSRRLFASVGAEIPGSPEANFDSEVSFQCPFERNTRGAVDLALRVFLEVYGLPKDFSLEAQLNV